MTIFFKFWITKLDFDIRKFIIQFQIDVEVLQNDLHFQKLFSYQKIRLTYIKLITINYKNVRCDATFFFPSEVF